MQDSSKLDPPEAPARQRADGRWTVTVCPLCGAIENHLHGAAAADDLGYKAPHCLVRWPHDPVDYRLVDREPTAEEIAAGEARRREIAGNLLADGWSRRELRRNGLLR